MDIIERVKNISVSPKTEWAVIDNETSTPGSLFTGYVLPLAIVSSLGSLLKGLFFAGTLGFTYFIVTAVIALVASLIAFYVSAIIIDMLAPSFASERNINKSAQLVAYSGTPSYIAGLLAFIPVIGWLIALAAWVYGIYIMYLGIGPLKKTPEDKKVVYMVISFILMIALYFIVAMVLGLVLYGAMGFTTVGR